jgi:hypothetical protein
MEIALAVLLVLSIPIIAITGLVIATGARDRVPALEQRFAGFHRRQPGPARPAPLPPAAIPAEPLPRLRTAAAASAQT